MVNIRTGKLDANAANEGGKYPFFTCSREPLRIDTYSYDCECVLVAGNGELNVKYYKGKFDAYQRTYIIEKKPEVDYISTYYIYLFFQKYIDVLRKGSIGGIIKYIKLGDLTIVRELDGINRLIDLQEEQLREYDRLAQSLFYSTFGDPTTNPKGWEVKKLGEVAEVVGGSTPKTSEEKNWIGTNNWISPAEIKDDDKYISSTERCISDDAALHLQLLPIGTVLLSSRAPIGKLAITRIPMYCNQGFKNIVCGKTLNNEYAYWYMKFNVGRLQEMGVGATFKEVSKTIVSAFPIMLPPLALQQSFAAQIEAIEQQKALIRRSLDETHTLLAARMQYYFNS